MTVNPERREITEVLMMNGNKGPVHRYIINGYKHISFSESQLRTRL